MRTNIRPGVSRLVIPALLMSVGLGRVAGAAPKQAGYLQPVPPFQLALAGRQDRAWVALPCVWNGASTVLLIAAAGDDSSDEVSALIQDARRDLAHLHFAEAKDKALSATSRAPKNAKAHALLGIAYIQLGDANSGESELKQAIGLDGNCALAHAGNGILALTLAGPAAGSPSSEAQKQLRRAEEEFNNALRLDSNEPSAHDGLGSVYYYRQKYPEAIREFRAALNQDPEFVASHFNLGNVYLATRKWSEAEDSYRKAINVYSRADFHALLAAALLKQGKAIEAVKEAKEARRLGLDSRHWIYKELKERGWDIGGVAVHLPHARAG